MMKEVVYAIMALILVGYLMTYLDPFIITLKDAGMSSVNMTDPVITNYYEMGDGLFGISGLVGIGAVGFLLFAYATRNDLI